MKSRLLSKDKCLLIKDKCLLTKDKWVLIKYKCPLIKNSYKVKNKMKLIRLTKLKGKKIYVKENRKQLNISTFITSKH